MLEIVFDENFENEFLGQTFPLMNMPQLKSEDIADYREIARRLIADNKKQRVIILKPADEGIYMNFYALALTIEAYKEDTCLETVVFKVEDSKKAAQEFRPFAALSNSVRYARDLFKFDERELISDVKRLGYLGLKVSEDYINNTLNLEWDGEQSAIKLCANDKNSMIVLVGVMKCLAINKEKRAIVGRIGEGVDVEAKKIENIASEDEIIEKIIYYVRELHNGN